METSSPGLLRISGALSENRFSCVCTPAQKRAARGRRRSRCATRQPARSAQAGRNTAARTPASSSRFRAVPAAASSCMAPGSCAKIPRLSQRPATPNTAVTACQQASSSSSTSAPWARVDAVFPHIADLHRLAAGGRRRDGAEEKARRRILQAAQPPGLWPAAGAPGPCCTRRRESTAPWRPQPRPKPPGAPRPAPPEAPPGTPCGIQNTRRPRPAPEAAPRPGPPASSAVRRGGRKIAQRRGGGPPAPDLPHIAPHLFQQLRPAQQRRHIVDRHAAVLLPADPAQPLALDEAGVAVSCTRNGRSTYSGVWA